MVIKSCLMLFLISFLHSLFFFSPAIRHASWYGGSSQHCPCVCMPSQQWFVYFFVMFFMFCWRRLLSHFNSTTVPVLFFSLSSFPKSAFQIRGDIIYFSASVLGQNQVQSPCFVSPPDCDRAGQCRFGKRNRDLS